MPATLMVLVDVHGRPRERLSLDGTLSPSFCSTVLLHDLTGRNVRLAGHGEDAGWLDLYATGDKPRAWAGDGLISFVRLTDREGRAHALCVRSVLDRSVRALAERGWCARVGIELEGLILPGPSVSDVDSRVSAVDGPIHRFYGPLPDRGGLARALDRIVERCQETEVALASYYREFEPHQLEWTTAPQEPMKAADDVVLLKRIIADSAAAEGLAANFLAQPYTGGAGNGMHVNVSLSRVGQDVWDEHTVHAYARTLADAVPWLTGIVAPTVNSFKRLRNPQFRDVERLSLEGRRDALVRVAGEPGSRRVEVRLPDPTANVYLAVAAALHCALLALSDAAPVGGSAVPASLGEALDRLAVSAAASDVLGADLVRAQVLLKRAELDLFAASVTPLEWELYAHTPVTGSG